MHLLFMYLIILYMFFHLHIYLIFLSTKRDSPQVLRLASLFIREFHLRVPMAVDGCQGLVAQSHAARYQIVGVGAAQERLQLELNLGRITRLLALDRDFAS